MKKAMLAAVLTPGMLVGAAQNPAKAKTPQAGGSPVKRLFKKVTLAAVLTTGLLVGASQNQAQAFFFPHDYVSGDGCTTFHYGWFGRYIGAVDNCY